MEKLRLQPKEHIQKYKMYTYGIMQMAVMNMYRLLVELAEKTAAIFLLFYRQEYGSISPDAADGLTDD